VASVLNKNFDLKVFLSGFFGNAVLSILLTMLGEKLNVDIYFAAIIIFVGRMFTNLGIIRRYYVKKWSILIEKRKNKKQRIEEEKQ
jgi:small basic protein